MIDETTRLRISKTLPLLDEDQRRKVAALEAEALGRNGVEEIHELTGMSKTTLYKGLKEIAELKADPKARPSSSGERRIRKEGGGRKKVEDNQPEINSALESLLEGNTVGNPESPICWTTKSLRHLSDELTAKGFKAGKGTVERLLAAMGFSLQQNRKYTESGDPGPDRDAQFRYINNKCSEFMKAGQPVISVDAKKKELIGNYKNAGAEYAPVKNPKKVLDHDFPTGDKATPYGVYDIGRNEGFVNVGISADTGAFAVNGIRNWWLSMGHERYPEAKSLYITCDGGGSNGRRNRLWKKCLEEFATETGLEINVSHFPPGTSKWNKIEHRLFSYISKNWRGRPLETIEIIVNLIASTTTKGGLKVMCVTDDNKYEKGIKISDEELAKINLEQDKWHGEWNYCIRPKKAQI